jgi:hypothetical protein
MEDFAPPGSDDTERARYAREVVMLLKRGLTAFRSYERGHGARLSAAVDLHRAIRQFTASWGELTLQITSRAFFFADEPISADEDEEDATTRPLFIEGIQGLNFLPGLTQDELERFLSLWHIAANARFPEGRSLSTEFWEAEFRGIETSVVENFSEGADADAATQDSLAAARARREELAVALTEGMSAAQLPGGGVVDGKQMRFVSSADLLPLTSSSAATLTDDLLSRLAAARREVINPLTDEERRALVAALSESGTTIARAHRTIWQIAPDAQPEDEEQLGALVARITRRFLEDGSIDLLRQGLTQTLAVARVNPDRVAQVGRFFETLAVAEVVGPLVDASRDRVRRDDAVAVLAFLPPAAMGLVLERIDGVVEDNDARTALLDLIRRKGTAPALFAPVIAALSTPTAAQTTTALLETAEKIRSGAALDLVSVCLAHAQAPVRRAVLPRIPLDAVAPIATSLAQTFMREPDADVRRDLLGLLMRAKSPEAIGPLLTLVQKGDVDVEEKKTYLRAIGTFGPAAAPAAASRLRRMFENERDVDLRCACALVLGSIGDEGARGLLDAEARRFFGNKALKTACADALKRLDARAPAGGPP